MKKTTLMLAACFFAFIAHSQDEKGGIRFGVRAGANFSNMTAKSQGIRVSLSSLVGLNAGVFVESPVGGDFAIQPELAFSQMGAKVKLSDGNSNVESKSTLSYITIPVLVKFKVPNTGLGIYTGPQFGLLMSAKDKEGSESIDSKDNYKSTDLAGVFGAEYFLPAGIGLSARYQLGFSNIAKTENGDNSTVKNKAFTITVCYRF